MAHSLILSTSLLFIFTAPLMADGLMAERQQKSSLDQISEGDFSREDAQQYIKYNEHRRLRVCYETYLNQEQQKRIQDILRLIKTNSLPQYVHNSNKARVDQIRHIVEAELDLNESPNKLYARQQQAFKNGAKLLDSWKQEIGRLIDKFLYSKPFRYGR